MKRKIYAIIGAVVAITVLALSGKMFEDADKSKNYVCQMPITGEYSVWTEGGLQMQWFGDIDAYAKTSQIEFSDLEKNQTGYVAVGPNPAAGTTFNDRGKGYIVGSFRVVLPTDDQNMMEIQRDFGSEEALINNLVRPTLYKVVTACGPLMSSLESVSETRTDLTAYITDQLNNGVYKTKTSKVEAINEITGEKELRTQAELIVDENAPGGYARQEKSPFSQYGITAGIVSIIDIKYDAATQQQIDAQKAANLSVITAKTQALEAQQKAITIEEQGKARAAEAKWAQEQEKAVAVTKAEQEREVARLAAEKAEFEKKKIIAQGQAEAEANRLKVNAGLTPQERAEWDYKTAVGIAQALANSKVSWVPSIMLTGGNTNSNNSAMDAVGLNMMLDVVKKMNEN
jgi:regulator of protease activity HflC (stomatin/prohibitin superfamily)